VVPPVVPAIDSRRGWQITGDRVVSLDADRDDDASIVFRDAPWTAEIAPGPEAPGWHLLRARRDGERVTGLDERRVGCPRPAMREALEYLARNS
jgi:hypothetical protein